MGRVRVVCGVLRFLDLMEIVSPTQHLCIDHGSPIYEPSLQFNLSSCSPRIPECTSGEDREYRRAEQEDKQEEELEDDTDCQGGGEGSMDPPEGYSDPSQGSAM